MVGLTLPQLASILRKTPTSPSSPILAVCLNVLSVETAIATPDQLKRQQGTLLEPLQQLDKDGLARLLQHHKACALLVGGTGAFRVDGRPHFGTRSLLSELVGGDPPGSGAGAGGPQQLFQLRAAPTVPVPAALWPDAATDKGDPRQLLRLFWEQHLQQQQ